jgi:hypothetical protein
MALHSPSHALRKIYARGSDRLVKKADPKSRTSHVRFGSLADVEARPADVRFTPKSGHRPYKRPLGGPVAQSVRSISLRVKYQLLCAPV